ncbi:hypothetical protein KI387_020114, partial [Taxus chinensis]
MSWRQKLSHISTTLSSITNDLSSLRNIMAFKVYMVGLGIRDELNKIRESKAQILAKDKLKDMAKKVDPPLATVNTNLTDLTASVKILITLTRFGSTQPFSVTSYATIPNGSGSHSHERGNASALPYPRLDVSNFLVATRGGLPQFIGAERHKLADLHGSSIPHFLSLDCYFQQGQQGLLQVHPISEEEQDCSNPYHPHDSLLAMDSQRYLRSLHQWVLANTFVEMFGGLIRIKTLLHSISKLQDNGRAKAQTLQPPFSRHNRNLPYPSSGIQVEVKALEEGISEVKASAEGISSIQVFESAVLTPLLVFSASLSLVGSLSLENSAQCLAWWPKCLATKVKCSGSRRETLSKRQVSWIAQQERYEIMKMSRRNRIFLLFLKKSHKAGRYNGKRQTDNYPIKFCRSLRMLLLNLLNFHLAPLAALPETNRNIIILKGAGKTHDFTSHTSNPKIMRFSKINPSQAGPSKTNDRDEINRHLAAQNKGSHISKG